jgi:tetratricopeptide (TPR) repeat protein
MKWNSKSQQIVLFVSSIILFVLLFIANKKAPSVGSDSKIANGNVKMQEPMVFAQYIDSISKSLDSSTTKQLDLANTFGLDSLIKFWDRQGKPEIASQIVIEKAKKLNNEESWMRAGERNFYAVPFVKTESVTTALYSQAMMCFQKVLEIAPNNTLAKIKLATCIVEGTSDPMKGIALLRELEKTDSNNVELQLNFAFFSIKSRQFEKAITRFEKVLKINPNYVQAYLHLADVYEQMGNKTKTIESLEKYAGMISDPVAKEEINKYINQLKTK